MQFLNAAALSAIVLSGFAAAQTALTVNTPGSLFQCQPGLLSWSGGTPPYFPRINQAGSTTVTIQQLPQTSSTSYTWTVNLVQGTTFTLAVADSTGAQQYSAVSPAIGAGSDSCLNSTSTSGSSSSSGATSSSSTAAGGSTTAASSSTTRSTTSSSSSTGSTPSASTSSAPNGAAKMQGYAAAAAGAVGVVVAALV